MLYLQPISLPRVSKEIYECSFKNEQRASYLTLVVTGCDHWPSVYLTFCSLPHTVIHWCEVTMCVCVSSTRELGEPSGS